ncbi:MAG: bifunctional precorrin-2 dehydrogenase/sirohydrochlorin ferrochelatase [Acidobacteria bacterium]|nr:bifunctional precorrin-2 dehydrogenase/sirohydrochlorin ferrochelatase [Acidobacteriota bacterium]
MLYYPIFLNLRSRKVLVVGGGRVAERKVKSLLPAGARVTVVAPQTSSALRMLAAAGKISWRARPYRASDMNKVILVFAATDSEEVERRVVADAARRGIPANCAGWPEAGSFLVPAQARRGDLQMAISTGGASPALARKLARELQARFGPEYAQGTRLLARFRQRILASVSAAQRPRLFQELVSDRILRLLRQGQKEQAVQLAERLIQKYADRTKQEFSVLSTKSVGRSKFSL